MFCISCGFKMNDGDLFCSACGQRASVGGVPASSAPVRPAPTSDEDGDEAVLYRKGNACYLKKANYWVPGAFVLARGYIAFYPRSYMKIIRTIFNEIDAISEAYLRDHYVCFSIRTFDGRVETYSVETVDLEETQAVIGQLRHESGIQKTFDPCHTL